MAFSYYKTFRVPYWVVLEKTQKDTTIMKWFREAQAHIQDWPANTFPETLKSFKGKGWKHVFDSKDLVIPPQLLQLAASNHAQENLGPNSVLSFRQPTHRLNRKVSGDEDYVRLFNEILEIQDPITLSQVFQVGEKCHAEGTKRTILWVSQEPCSKKVLTAISDRVITVGESDGVDINVKDVNARAIPGFLNKAFEEFFGKKTAI